VGAEALDGPHVGVAHLGEGHEAGIDRLSIEQHGAGPALALAAALFRSGQAALLAQHVE
jgi:hypothetical protein